MSMTKAPNRLTSLRHRLGISGLAHPARLCAFGGSGGSSRPRVWLCGLVPAWFLTALMLVCFTPGTALAASLETPETGVAEPTATTAVLHGVVNPAGLGLAGGWQFHYAPSETECAGGGVAPALPELTLGAKEAVEESVTELQPAKKYTFCLVASDLSNESASGALVPFETLPLPPALTTASEKASLVTPTGANLEATLNPNNEETTYTFEYSTKGKTGAGEKLEAPIVEVPSAPGVLPAEFVESTVAVPTEVLAPDTTYFYRVVAENKKSKEEGKAVTGPVQSFTSAPEAPTTSTPAKSVTATTAELEGVLNPKAEAKAGWYFAYSTGATCTGAEKSAQEPEATVKAATETKTVTNLEPSQKYTFCLVATNAAGTQTTAGNPETLETKPAPPEIQAASVKASGASPYEQTLEAQVNPNNQKTSYTFQYSTEEAGGRLSGAVVTLKGAGPLERYGYQTASVSTGRALTPGATYHLRVIAENATGKIEGAGEFTTPLPTAPVIEGEFSSGLTAEKAKLEAIVNPDFQATTCKFEYATEEAKVGTADATTVPCEPSEHLASGLEGGVIVAAPLAGLQSNTAYYFRVAATNATGTTTDPTIETFKTEPAVAPAIVFGSESVSDVKATSATLHATVEPGGLETAYRFEYAPVGSEFKPVTEPKGSGALPEGVTPIPLEVHMQTLSANTTYEFRIVVSNSVQQGVTGEPVSFTTQQTGGEFALPDGRQYEMVTPPDKHGALVARSIPEYGRVVQAAADGSAIAYTASAPTESGVLGYGQSSEVQVLSARGPGGWSSRDVAIPDGLGASAHVGGDAGPIPSFFYSPDLSHAVVQPFGAFLPCRSAEGALQPCLSPDASEQTAFLADLEGTSAPLRERGISSERPTYTPLVTGCPSQAEEQAGKLCEPGVAEHANVPPGTAFGLSQEVAVEAGGVLDNACPRSIICGPMFRGATPDLSHIVVQSRVPLTAEAFPKTGDNETGPLYEYTDGQLALLSVLPDGELVPPGSQKIGVGEGGTPPNEEGSFWHAISEDGSRVVFYGKGQHNGGHLYLRENALQPQSALAHGGASGIGNLEAGSDQVTEAKASASAGAFAVGQTVSASEIPAGTTITKVEEESPGSSS